MGIEDPHDRGNSPGQAHRVLVVDDDDAVRRVFVRGLRRLGYAVDEASSAAGAGERLRSDPGYDVVITDVHLGDGDGTEEVARAVTRDRAPCVLVVTGSSDEDATEARDRLPSWVRSATLPKPFALEELERIMAELLAGC